MYTKNKKFIQKNRFFFFLIFYFASKQIRRIDFKYKKYIFYLIKFKNIRGLNSNIEGENI